MAHKKMTAKPRSSRATGAPTREEVIQQVSDGRMKPAQADQIAISAGWPPFSHYPDWQKFNAIERADADEWTAAMVITWISTKDPKQLTEWDPVYLAACSDWESFVLSATGKGEHRVVNLGFRQQIGLPPRALHDRLTDVSGPGTINAAFSDLEERLRSGEIAAWGVSSETNRHEPIPSGAWKGKARLEICYGLTDDYAMIKSIPIAGMTGFIRYDALRFDRSTILATWPLDIVQTDSAAPATRPKHTPGQKSFEEKDRPLLDEMDALIKSGKALSANAAAIMVADRAHGSATPESKAGRLARRYLSLGMSQNKAE